MRVRASHEPGEGKDQLPLSCTHAARSAVRAGWGAPSRQMCLCRRESKSNRYGPERARGVGWVAAEPHVSVCTCWVV